jgi:hypothetical protein
LENEINLFEVGKALMQWVILPVSAFVWMMYRTQQDHSTDIAVLKATTSANKEAHDREFKQIQESFKAVFTKLDTIEQALRK